MSIKKYYLLGLVPFSIIVFVLFFSGIDILNITIFSIGFIFPYSINTPGLREKVQRYNYRFSFLRFALLIYDFAYDLIPKYKDYIASLIYPALFSLFITILTLEVSLHFVLLGWACWILFLQISSKSILTFEKEDTSS